MGYDSHHWAFFDPHTVFALKSTVILFIQVLAIGCIFFLFLPFFFAVYSTMKHMNIINIKIMLTATNTSKITQYFVKFLNTIHIYLNLPCIGGHIFWERNTLNQLLIVYDLKLPYSGDHIYWVRNVFIKHHAYLNLSCSGGHICWGRGVND